ncbi:hypothetical protein ABZ714_10130 [Streptomyces sp. NPDC006798]|uniref:hypothetical protein n=1 Tax=Streptomyces sp. NPDC006798 TaxID=3155462 RepID=UPI0033DFB13E
MTIWKRTAGVVAAGALAALGPAPAPAAAVPISYEADACGSSGNRYCFALHYNSRGGQTWYSDSPCFVSNKDIPNHAGYSPNGVAQVVYVFTAGQMNWSAAVCVLSNSGDGQPVKNNAASAANGECSVSYRVYYNSGYSGPNQTFGPTCGDYWPAVDLNSGVKNNNASSARL